jgi:hypothetical protein
VDLMDWVKPVKPRDELLGETTIGAMAMAKP